MARRSFWAWGNASDEPTAEQMKKAAEELGRLERASQPATETIKSCKQNFTVQLTLTNNPTLLLIALVALQKNAH